jgi:hypothetical protein
MYDYYKNETSGSIEDWQSFMSNVDASFYAYAEFKFYILRYLMYARKHKKDIYEGILSNTSFKNAYQLVDVEYAKLISDYFSLRTKLLSKLQEQGHEVEITEKFTFIDGSGTGNFTEVYNKLMKEMEKDQYLSIMTELKK